MILGIGTDIIENERIAGVYERRGERFLKRVFSEQEIEYALSHEDPVPYLAARFAVKEAAIKALNLRETVGLSMLDVEVAGKAFGKKHLVLKGPARRIADEMGANKFHISISHTHTMSMAIVILEG